MVLQSSNDFVTNGAMKILLLLVGMVFILEGLPYVANPEAMQRWLRKLCEVPPAQLRVAGFLAMLAGFLICYFVDKTSFFS